MRVLLIYVWCGVILIFTSTASFYDLIHLGVVRFQWESSPSYSDLLLPFPSEVNIDLLLQKLGHIVVFLILTGLMLTKYRSTLYILLISFSFAVLTEFLQLHFTRGGRLFDIGFDLIGILLGLGASNLFKTNQSRIISMKN